MLQQSSAGKHQISFKSIQSFMLHISTKSSLIPLSQQLFPYICNYYKYKANVIKLIFMGNFQNHAAHLQHHQQQQQGPVNNFNHPGANHVNSNTNGLPGGVAGPNSMRNKGGQGDYALHKHLLETASLPNGSGDPSQQRTQGSANNLLREVSPFQDHLFTRQTINIPSIQFLRKAPVVHIIKTHMQRFWLLAWAKKSFPTLKHRTLIIRPRFSH